MIRAAIPSDVTELLAVTEAIGLEAEEIGTLRSMLNEYFQASAPTLPSNAPSNAPSNVPSNVHSDEHWLVDDDSGLVSVAYYAPERMTQGTWNLYLIAVRPEFQGKGRGSAMLRYVEDNLRQKGERLLIVETSGLEYFAPARAFYRKNGFEQEARIRDFYSSGEDKIVFCKALNPVKH